MMITWAMSSRLGTSYMTLSSTSSRIARRPRAPVPRSSARSAIASIGVRGELELDAVELEELVELLDQGVARLDQDPDQRIAVQRADRGDHRQPADELRESART